MQLQIFFKKNQLNLITSQEKYKQVKEVDFMLIMDKGKDTEMYPTHNEVISVQIIFRTLKKKIYKYMTSISKNVYIDQLTDISNECNNTYQNTIKMNAIMHIKTQSK